MQQNIAFNQEMGSEGIRIQRFLSAVDQLSDALGLSVPPIFELEVLRQLPSGTLGRSLAEHFEQYQLQPFVTGSRRKQLHDCVHILTGYDTSPIGEAEVQAFLLGAKFQVINVALGLGLLRLIHRRCPDTPQLWQRLWWAYQRGQTSSFDIDRWQPETQWHLPLTQVQHLLQI